ncbi:MAG: putative FAD dependent oxidoreductase [Acidimicrobiaceae bacterium]|nr:MAG: putative FAD dependent oxidoreductase [Acidimicrobiaceae bacterium]
MNSTTTDVVVVGAGVAGVSAAAELAAFRHVVMVEQEVLPAHHASGRSAAVLSETSGHPVVCSLTHLSRPFFEQPVPGFTDHRLLSPRGLVWVGEADDGAALDALAIAAARVAPTVGRLSPSAARRMLPSFGADAVAGGGVHEPDAMTIDAAALIQGYVRLLHHRGGSLLTSTEAVRLDRTDQGWTVTAGTSTIRAKVVVNAAGAWGDVVAARAGVAPLRLEPRRRTAAIARVSESVALWPVVMDVGGRYYCQPDPGGLLISPADESPSVPCDAQPEEVDVAQALDRVRDATGLPLRSIVRAWAGLRTFAPDGAPVMGEDPDAPGFWWLVGQGGAGIKTAPALATMLARQVEGIGPTADQVELGVTYEALSPTRLRC